ncbi:CPCC family cysteine-rich protein [Streptomyces sp. NPDC059278]|uniref:CPCC family cysteine-rich protein n=1 Tax=Streptomyces sp. NPDC059278 TaxID=3346801 RepID=UPI00368438F5
MDDKGRLAVGHRLLELPELVPRPKDPAFFISRTARRLIYAVVAPTFRQLVTATQVGTDAPNPPRLHDLRHTFAIRTPLQWYHTGDNVQLKIPSLSTYLGHPPHRSPPARAATSPPTRSSCFSTACEAADHGRRRRKCDTQGVMTPSELREACPSGEGPYACPCCKLPTLDARVEWEICHECGWEDDGQDDLNADEVWGGPNGSDSLTDARIRYAQYVATAGANDSRSVANGGQGRWFEACRTYRASRHLPERFAASPTPAAMPNTAEQVEASTSGDLTR